MNDRFCVEAGGQKREHAIFKVRFGFASTTKLESLLSFMTEVIKASKDSDVNLADFSTHLVKSLMALQCPICRKRDEYITIAATISHVRSIRLDSILSFATEIRRIAQEADEGNISSFGNKLAEAIESLLCGVCNGRGEVGARLIIKCPQCQGTGWNFPK